MNRFPKRYADIVQRLRVPMGFALIACFGLLSQPTPRSLFWGVPVAFAGLALRAWAAGHLEKNQTLTVSGPYAWMRNPLYGGTLLAAFGFALAGKRPLLAWLSFLVFYFVYLPAVEQEENHLRSLFPSFQEYAARVRMLWPTFPEDDGGDHKAFSWALYRKNREYQAAIAFVAALVFYCWKAYGAG